MCTSFFPCLFVGVEAHTRALDWATKRGILRTAQRHHKKIRVSRAPPSSPTQYRKRMRVTKKKPAKLNGGNEMFVLQASSIQKKSLLQIFTVPRKSHLSLTTETSGKCERRERVISEERNKKEKKVCICCTHLCLPATTIFLVKSAGEIQQNDGLFVVRQL